MTTSTSVSLVDDDSGQSGSVGAADSVPSGSTVVADAGGSGGADVGNVENSVVTVAEPCTGARTSSMAHGGTVGNNPEMPVAASGRS